MTRGRGRRGGERKQKNDTHSQEDYISHSAKVKSHQIHS